MSLIAGICSRLRWTFAKRLADALLRCRQGTAASEVLFAGWVFWLGRLACVSHVRTIARERIDSVTRAVEGAWVLLCNFMV